MNNWIYIDEIGEFPDVISAHCDTRDFCVLLVADADMEKDPAKECNLPKEIFEKCLFDKHEIISYLKSLEIASGGNKDWRMLTFDSIKHKKAYDGWLKYIRFYRIEHDRKTKYFAYSYKLNRIL